MFDRAAARQSGRQGVRSPGAIRQVRHRQRARDDVKCFWVPVHRSSSRVGWRPVRSRG